MPGIIEGSQLWDKHYERPAADRDHTSPTRSLKGAWDDYRQQYGDTFDSEGWAVILNGTVETDAGDFVDLLRIERADGVGRFRTDAAAREYVKRRAREGSECHRRALKLVGETY